MEWHLILFTCVLVGHLLTTASGGHKHVIVHIPYRVRTVHHKRTVAKDVGGGDGEDHVIGFSGGENFGRLQAMLDATASQRNLVESYGGGHGQNWLQASQASESSSVNGFQGGHNFVNTGQFGGDFREGSFEDDFGFTERYFTGPNGLDTNLKYK
ncbi:hypothetical protein Trydic_g16326 [Trypoxylus dichotomus]